MSYERHEFLVAKARLRPAFWRLILGLAVMAVAQVLALTVLILGVGLIQSPDQATRIIVGLIVPVEPLPTLLVLFTFLGLGIGTWIAARLLQKRSFRSLFGNPATVLRHFAVAATTIFLFFGAMLIFMPSETLPGLQLTRWLLFLPVALVAILFQTAAEEIAFRGYLQTQLAARFTSPFIWLFVPALLFGVLHYAPQIQGETATLVLIAATMFGLIAGDLTARTGSIGAAWGFHFANNSMAILIVATPGALSGLALRLQPREITIFPDTSTIVVELLLLVFGWLAVRRLLSA